jgi:bifunctional DNA-binding transcriptional regulator/antitoxin component of YhaV-PrlF toxin-antitoxin module
MTELATIVDNGCVSLPESMRNQFAFATGTRLLAFSDGDNIILKPFKNPDAADFKRFCCEAQKYAAETEMTPADIQNAIKAVRRKK